MAASDAVERLSSRFGDKCVTSAAVRDHHAKGEAHHAPVLPDAVLFPASTDDVREIVRICHDTDCPITAFGAGTSLEGHVIRPARRYQPRHDEDGPILAVHPEDMDAVVQPGVTRRRLNENCARPACSFPSIPARMPRSAAWRRPVRRGTNAVRYGTMRENVWR